MIKLSKNVKTAYLAVIISVIFASCGKYIAPEYTNVDQLIKVRKGMTITKVNEVLGIQPFDLQMVQDDGGTVLVYNYRVKDRRAKVTGTYDKFVKSEAAQKSGMDWYGDPSRVYILFEDDKMAGLITDIGREDAEILMIVNNNLQLVAKNDLVNMRYYHNTQQLLMLNEDGFEDQMTVPKESKSNGMDRSIWLPRNKANTKSKTSEEKVNSQGE